MRNIFKILISLMISCTTALAAGASWEFAGWYGGGCYPNLVLDPHTKGRVYLASDVAGIFRLCYFGVSGKTRLVTGRGGNRQAEFQLRAKLSFYDNGNHRNDDYAFYADLCAIVGGRKRFG